MQSQPRFYLQISQRSYPIPTPLEPKVEAQTTTPNSNQYSQKEPAKAYSNPNNKPGFIPIRTNPRKFPKNQPHNLLQNLYQFDVTDMRSMKLRTSTSLMNHDYANFMVLLYA